MKIEAGKYYRTRDGRKAYVSAVILENPFGSPRFECDYPCRGFIEDSGYSSWQLNGKWAHENNDSTDLVAEWSDEPEYRPFNDAELRELVGRVLSKDGRTCLVVSHQNGKISASGEWLSSDALLKKWRFRDTGEPCGVRVKTSQTGTMVHK